MNSTSSTLKKDNYIIPGLLLLLLAGIILPGEATFVLGVLLIFINIFRTGKIVIGTHSSLWVFFIIWVLGIIMDLYTHDHENPYVYLRFTFYILSPVLYIYYGAIMNKTHSLQSIIKTFFVAAGINVIYFMINFFMNISALGISFNALRVARVTSTLLVLYAVFIYLLYGMSIKIINKKLDKIIFATSLICVFLSFLRSYLLFLFIGLFIYVIAYRQSGRVFKLAKIVFVPVLILLVVLFSNESLMKVAAEYVDMIVRSAEEMSTESIWTIENISSNWRGYEIFLAQKQFLKGDILQKVFGGGAMGIYVGDAARLVAQGTIGGFIPLLHNGFYGVLTYSGLAGIVLFLYFYLEKFFYGIKHFMKYHDPAAVLLQITVLGSMSITYVMAGPISASGALYSSLAIGFLMKYLSRFSEGSRQLIATDLKELNSIGVKI